MICYRGPNCPFPHVNDLRRKRRNATVIAPLFAADPIVYVGVAVVICVLVLGGFIWLLMKQYRRCPGNRLLVIYGKTGGAGYTQKVIHGGAAFVWPLFQDYAYLSLDPLQIEVPLRGALSIENIRVNVPSVFTVAVSTDEGVMHNAAVRLLGLPRQEIEKLASDIIFGQLRQVIASMADRRHQPRSRPRFCGSMYRRSLEPELSQGRPGVDQRQHHRHHRRVGLHRRDWRESLDRGLVA